MKIIAAVLFALIFSSVCFAQNSAGASGEPVSVLWANFKVQVNRQQNQQTVSSGVPYIQDTNNYSHSAPPRDNIQYRQQIKTVELVNRQELAQVRFRNNSTKKVDSIEYDFIVVGNKDGKELNNYKFTSNTDIRPGATKTISSAVAAFKRVSSVSYKAKITRVKYTDGSVWIP